MKFITTVGTLEKFLLLHTGNILLILQYFNFFQRQAKLEQRDFKEQKHCLHCPKHTSNEEKREHRSSISKVQKWSNEYEMETSFIADKCEEKFRIWPQELKNM